MAAPKLQSQVYFIATAAAAATASRCLGGKGKRTRATFYSGLAGAGPPRSETRPEEPVHPERSRRLARGSDEATVAGKPVISGLRGHKDERIGHMLCYRARCTSGAW